MSENPEKAIEESKLYFPTLSLTDDPPSDDEEKLEDLEVNLEEKQKAETVCMNSIENNRINLSIH